MEKTLNSRKTGWQADEEFGLDGSPGDVNHENVLDLLTVIEDERRFHAAAAVLAEDPVEGERYRAMAHEASLLLAGIRRGLSRITRAHLSRRERARQLQRYAYRLMVRTQRPRGRVLSSATNLQGAKP